MWCWLHKERTSGRKATSLTTVVLTTHSLWTVTCSLSTQVSMNFSAFLKCSPATWSSCAYGVLLLRSHYVLFLEVKTNSQHIHIQPLTPAAIPQVWAADPLNQLLRLRLLPALVVFSARKHVSERMRSVKSILYKQQCIM